MTVTLLPDVEALLGTFLRAQSEVTALASSRVYTELPAGATFPLYRIRRIGGAPVRSHPLHLDAALLQVESYASNKATARAMAATAMAVISQRIEATHAAGNVSGCRFGSLLWLPDEDFTPPKPRYIFDLTLYCSPLVA